jgi:Rrf2 family cysteine metabolism transcriptional repressor
MPLLSRKADYALLILSYLNQRAVGGCAREIADRFHLSRAFVANILKELCHKGFVTSHRGVNGGYVLARPADEVQLVEVIESLDDSFRFAECNAPGDDGCSIAPTCPLKGPVAEIHRRIREVLSEWTLADLFNDGHSSSRELLELTLPEPMLVR